MALIFTDTLQVANGSGLYTLQGYVGQDWTDIHTIAGDMNGDISVSSTSNVIDVNYTVFIPGNSYEFRWVDGNGAASNIVTCTIPQPVSIIRYYYGVIPTTLVNNGPDDWTLTVPYTAPAEYGGDHTLTSMNVQIDFYQNGNVGAYSQNVSGLTADTTYDLAGNGAGTYNIQVSYIMSDGSQYTPQRVVMLDGGTTIVRDIQANGFSGISAELTALTATIALVTSGCTVTDQILVVTPDFATFTYLAEGMTLTSCDIPIRTENIFAYLCTLVAAEWTDLPSGVLTSPIGCYTEVFMNV